MVHAITILIIIIVIIAPSIIFSDDLGVVYIAC